MAIGGLMDTNIPSQLDEADLLAELEIEIPDSGQDMSLFAIDEDGPEIEIIEDDDGSVVVDFDPTDQRGVDDDFYGNLAEEMPERELNRIASDLLGAFDSNKSGRQEWEDAYTDGLDLLGFNYEERTQPFRGASGVTHPLLASV